MLCTACNASAHKLTRVADGVWHCKECKVPAGHTVIKGMSTPPPDEKTINVLVGFIAIPFKTPVESPDYSRN